MLTKKERKVMDVVYLLCREEGNCLCNSWDILRRFDIKENFDEAKLEKILADLQADGYLTVIPSDRHGERVYVITLCRNGLFYRREGQQVKRSIYFKIAVTVLGAIASFLIGLVLRALFT